MNEQIIKFFLGELMIFKISLVGLSITTYEGICLHTVVLRDSNQVLRPCVDTVKQVH